MRDNDGGDCVALKSTLTDLCQRSGRQDVLVRIPCQELEAWYFGDCDALASAFGREQLRQVSTRKRYRDPDAIEQPGRALAELVDGFQKVSGARLMGRHLRRENSSRSFRVLIDGLDRIQASLRVPPP